MRCLITGGYGYVGAHVAAHAAALGHEVFVLSRGEARSAPFAHTHIRADLTGTTPAELAALLPDNLEACAHLAAVSESFVPGYPHLALEANAYGTRNLLEALTLCPGPRPHVVYSSTFHVYGRTGGRIDASTPPAPKTDYALTHLFAEEYGRMFARTQNLPFSVLRLTNGYGAPLLPGSDKWYLLCNDLCRQALREGGITLKAHPDTQRDFVHLPDIAAAFCALLPKRELSGRIYNIASGRAVTLGEVARTVARAAKSFLGREIPVVFAGTGEAPAGEPLYVSNEDAHKDLGFTADPSMETHLQAIFKSLEAAA